MMKTVVKIGIGFVAGYVVNEVLPQEVKDVINEKVQNVKERIDNKINEIKEDIDAKAEKIADMIYPETEDLDSFENCTDEELDDLITDEYKEAVKQQKEDK